MSAAAATNDEHQRGGRRNAATITSPSRRNGRSRTVVMLAGVAENTQNVMPSTAHPASAVSSADTDGDVSSGLCQRTAHAITTGAMHKDPSQFPAHHNCHSRQ